MNRIYQCAAVVALAAGAFAVLPGCQNAGKKDETSRPMGVSATYDRAYLASRDTDAMMALGSTGPKSPIAKGTRAYFADVPGSAEYQQARVEGQGVMYVRVADFTKEVR